MQPRDGRVCPSTRMSLDERIDDLDLLRNWRAGDARAGDRLLARHFGAVYRFFRSKAGPAAESLAQATFVGCRDEDQARRAVETNRQGRGRDPDASDPAIAFKARLFSMARRRLLDHFGGGERAVDPATATLAGLVRDQACDAVHAALFGLPIDVQIAIELHHWERLSVADVGHVIGLGAGAVKGRLARVRKQLDPKVLRGPASLLDADGQRAWASVRARVFEGVFEGPTRGGFTRYRVVERVDYGGVGRTFVAHDEELGRTVALTLVGVEQAAAAERIVRAAKARVGIVDPHRVEVLDAGITRDARAFVLVGPWAAPSATPATDVRVVWVVTELVRGATLRNWAGARARSGAELIDVFVGAGLGLAVAHSHGLVHGGFEADDVIVADDGSVRLFDLGLAGADQFADARSDQPAFCLALRDALAGTLLRAVEPTPRPRTAASYLLPLPGMPTGLHRAIVKGLAIDPAERWPDMGALLDVLARQTMQTVASRTTPSDDHPFAVAE